MRKKKMKGREDEGKKSKNKKIVSDTRKWRLKKINRGRERGRQEENEEEQID